MEPLHIGVHAEASPDKPAYVMEPSGEVVTYGQLEERSRRIAQLFASLGLRRGDHIAILATNHPRYLEVTWGAHRGGLYYTPVNWHLTSDEVRYIVEDSGAQVLVASADLAALASEVPLSGARYSIGGTIAGFEPLEDAAAAFPSEPLPDEVEGVWMFYTSGTTGRPKGSKPPLAFDPLGTGRIVPESVAVGAAFAIDRDCVYLSPGAPLYHGAPMLFNNMVLRLGGTCVILERFDPLLALQAIEKHRVTTSQWVPTMFTRLLRLSEQERNGPDLSSMRMAFHAAAPCPIPVKEQMLDWWGPIVHEYYGSSEGGGMCFITPQEWETHKGSVGKAAVGIPHICDEDGNELPPGQTGVIYFENGSPIAYHNDEAKTRRAHNAHGWATVGDIGYLDEDGYLYLTDRRDHMIISGGVNIYPLEAENVLSGHPAVLDVAVIGVPNDEFGEEVKAVVQLADGASATEAELIGYCREHLARYKCPRTVDFVSELPRSDAGKLYKRKLRDAYWAGRDTSLV